MSIHVIKPGILTTVQDLGRWGFQSSGVSVAGPMDAYAHRLANALVGNLRNDATLEVTLVGPELECDDERVVAVTGAQFEVTVDDRPVPMNAAIVVAPRSRLKVGRRIRGARAYIAVGGGIDVPLLFGSRATHLTAAMGGFQGRALRAGDRLPVGPRHGPARAGRHVRLDGSLGPGGRTGTLGPGAQTGADGHVRVRVLPGPQDDYFSADTLRTLQSASYAIDPQSDRMGFRLEGAALAHARQTEMISDATPMGALQVPPSGQPILLMADRQTAGGYPMIVTVITADLSLAGQLAPGDSIAFAICSRTEAAEALIARERLLMAVERQEPA